MTIAFDSRSYVIELSGYSTSHRSSMQAVYLRRRLVVAMAALIVVLAACLGLRALAHLGGDTASGPEVMPLAATGLPVAADDLVSVQFGQAVVQGRSFYVVQSGDTLWSIASSLTDGSIRSYVKRLAGLNGGESVRVGQRLILPND